MIDLDTPIDDVLSAYPQLGGLFVRMHLLCVGCDIAHFHSLKDVAGIYEIDPVELREKIEAWLDKADTDAAQ